MKSDIRIIKIILKSYAKLYFIPYIIVLLIVPFLDARYYVLAEGMEGSIHLVNSVFQRFIPFAAVWWIFLIMKEYIEGDGRELLYVYSVKTRRIKREIMMVFLWYLCHAAVVMAVHAFWFPYMHLMFLQIAAQSLVFAGLFVLLAVLSRNTGISLLLCAIYYFAISTFDDTTIFRFIDINHLGECITAADLREKYVWVALAGIIFFAAGFEVIKRREMK